MNEYFRFNFELNIELNHFLARFNIKMNNQNVSLTPMLQHVFQSWLVWIRGINWHAGLSTSRHTGYGTMPAEPVWPGAYLIFVISFTQAAFLNSKFYIRKFTKNTPKHPKMSLKSKISAVFVFNLENFTPDRIFLHGHRPWCP